MECRTQIAPSLMANPVSLVRWGPIVAGLVATLAAGWLLSMIGTGLGLSIADAADADQGAEFKRLGLGVVAWMFFSWAAAFFIGGATTGRFLASDDLLGKVHGFTLWSLGTVLWIVVAAIGATGLVAVGTVGVAKVAGAGASAVKAVGQAAGQAASSPGIDDALLAPLTRRLEAEISVAAAEAANEAAPGAGAAPGQVAAALDADTLQAVAAEVIAGRPETARHVLMSRASMTADQADALVAGVQGKAQSAIDDVKRKAEIAAQRAVDFTQAVVWTMSAGALLGLAACMLGGALGARCAARHTTTWMREPVEAPRPTTGDVAVAH